MKISSLFTKKKQIHEPETQKQKEQKLLRFTRGNQTLTVEQQEELYYLTEKNLRTIQRHLAQMKGLYHENKKFEK